MPAPGHLRQSPAGTAGAGHRHPGNLAAEGSHHEAARLRRDPRRRSESRSARHQWCRGHDSQPVEITNWDYAVYDKTNGKVLLSPVNINTIFNGFGGRCENTNPGDPVVIWDKPAQRWLVSYINYSGSDAICIAVSTMRMRPGSYSRYEYYYSQLPDYPKYAVWPDAYYGSTNINGSYAQPCAYDRNAMLAVTAAQICFTTGAFTLLPSDVDGTTAPPAGAPDHFLGLGNSTNELKEYDFHVDFAQPKKSSLTGPILITVPNFSEACGGYADCIQQPAPGEEVEDLGDRLMFRLAYRNFGDHEALVVAQNVTPGAGSTAQSAMRWMSCARRRPERASRSTSLVPIRTKQTACGWAARRWTSSATWRSA